MNVITNFNSSNTIIAAAVAKLMSVKAVDPKTFRLSVATADDVMPEGTGQFKLEAPVVLQLIDTAYAEIVSVANRITRKDQLIALHDRHRHNSGWDDIYDGSEEPEETEQSIEEQLIDAIDRAEVILRYGKHIAAIKAGGAEWLAGFEVDKWVPVEGLSDDELLVVQQACVSEVGLSKFIELGKVKKVRSVVDNRLLGFNEWCNVQIHRKGQDEGWKNKLAYARTLGIVLSDIPVNTACEYIGDIVLSEAFNRPTTRLEDAVRRVANNRYINVAYTIQNELAATTPNRRAIDKAMAKSWEMLCYSDMLQKDIAEVKKSDEWQDYQLDLDVKAAEEEAKQDFRQAMREQAMFAIEKRALEIQKIRSQAENIRAMLAKERSELLQAAPVEDDSAAKAEAEAKAKRAAAAKKAAETRTRKAAEKKAAQTTKGIHKASTKPVLNVAGNRTTH